MAGRRRSDVELAAARVRDELVRLERQNAQRLAAAHRLAFSPIGLRPYEQALVSAIRARIESGEPVTRGWLTNEPRWRAFEQLVRSSAVQFGEFAVRAVREQMWAFAERGTQDAGGVLSALIGEQGLAALQTAGMFQQVNVDAVIQMVGQLQLSSPLTRLPGMGETMTHLMGRDLVRGVARGEPARVIGRTIAKSTGVQLSRALTISRTETFRAYREASRMVWDESLAVDRWMWVCSGGAGTCVACWAMDGEVFDTSDPMGTHPNCQCTMVPLLNSEARDMLDLDEPELPEPGEAFAGKDEDFQRGVLGPARFEQYQQGAPLSSFVQETQTRDWGVTRTVAPLGG